MQTTTPSASTEVIPLIYMNFTLWLLGSAVVNVGDSQTFFGTKL